MVSLTMFTMELKHEMNEETHNESSCRNGSSVLALGQIVATPGVLAAVPLECITAALHRHAAQDWGIVCEDDWKQNDYAAEHDERIFSAYLAPDRTKFWIITEWDRSCTTVLLPEEY